MKRQKLLQHLRSHGCLLAGEGGRHTRVINPANQRRSVVPRHREISDRLTEAICKQLGVPVPGST